MAAWGGQGIPPTRKKLYRLRESRRREVAKLEKVDRAQKKRLARRDRSIDEALRGIRSLDVSEAEDALQEIGS